jgi:hypothetical protein
MVIPAGVTSTRSSSSSSSSLPEWRTALVTSSLTTSVASSRTEAIASSCHIASRASRGAEALQRNRRRRSGQAGRAIIRRRSAAARPQMPGSAMAAPATPDVRTKTGA